MNFEALVRPEILAMSPYASARSSAAADGVLLNANEAPSMLLDGSADISALALNRYPPPQPEDLRQRLADRYQVEPQQVLVTRGSDEGIDLLLRVFCRPGQDAILECPPCFGMYRVAAQIQGARVLTVERKAGTLLPDGPALVAAIGNSPDLKLVFLTSPNNPTGDVLPAGLLEQVIQACGERALVVLDEAYIEFCATPSAAQRVRDLPQLVVLRTLSKAWASAGLRCGAVIADPKVISLLRRVMAPYPLSTPAIAAALKVTGEAAVPAQAAMLDMLGRNKQQLLDSLARRDWVRKVWPGEANFVLVRVDDGPGLVRFCADHGVRLRDFSSQPLLQDCVRLTIGNEADMRALDEVLDLWGQRT
jgi:histidinol-phosphate aminotransferase